MLGRLYSPEVCCDTSFSHQQCIIAGTQPVGAVNIFSEVKKTGLERTSSDCIDFLIFRSKITYHDEDMRNFQNRSGARDLFKKKKIIMTASSISEKSSNVQLDLLMHKISNCGLWISQELSCANTLRIIPWTVGIGSSY